MFLTSSNGIKRVQFDSKTYVALLRGINVGEKNKLRMMDLAETFVEAGCHMFKPIIRSGTSRAD
jgi:DNA phosphorothioation-dependent restriction protein DptG